MGDLDDVEVQLVEDDDDLTTSDDMSAACEDIIKQNNYLYSPGDRKTLDKGGESGVSMFEADMNQYNLTTNKGFMKAVRASLQGEKHRNRTPTLARGRLIDTERKSIDREKQLRNMLQKDKVIVFNREVFQPWDHVPRFDFLECNLKTIMKEGDVVDRRRSVTKDAFIGNINQLKP